LAAFVTPSDLTKPTTDKKSSSDSAIDYKNRLTKSQQVLLLYRIWNTDEETTVSEEEFNQLTTLSSDQLFTLLTEVEQVSVESHGLKEPETCKTKRVEAHIALKAKLMAMNSKVSEAVKLPGVPNFEDKKALEAASFSLPTSIHVAVELPIK